MHFASTVYTGRAPRFNSGTM